METNRDLCEQFSQLRIKTFFFCCATQRIWEYCDRFDDKQPILAFYFCYVSVLEIVLVSYLAHEYDYNVHVDNYNEQTLKTEIL